MLFICSKCSLTQNLILNDVCLFVRLNHLPSQISDRLNHNYIDYYLVKEHWGNVVRNIEDSVDNL